MITKTIALEEYNKTRDELLRLERVAITACTILRMHKEGCNMQDYPIIMNGLEESLVKTEIFEWINELNARIKSGIKANAEKAKLDSSDVK
jgi:hypothetical protein